MDPGPIQWYRMDARYLLRCARSATLLNGEWGPRRWTGPDRRRTLRMTGAELKWHPKLVCMHFGYKITIRLGWNLAPTGHILMLGCVFERIECQVALLLFDEHIALFMALFRYHFHVKRHLCLHHTKPNTNKHITFNHITKYNMSQCVCDCVSVCLGASSGSKVN